ncbi:CDGSH iron-sulfur domain-containing protein [Halocynthiibacter sp. C4]|uniref:CDGSH iron-sulfur domain-containing protein n=1 Tax=Halocynthiibacter sp. C4 TaxID=2992758 RepID=UPI00237B9C85|nr:CDGSH iron-sulfur domain-containing protein [Halocynthiibacter sp. C4]MDE0590962.1 CDGSH iron-sulfur domain-containing protein [Halocynthiibacter sp. C4]
MSDSNDDAAKTPEIEPVENGPLRVKGELNLVGADAEGKSVMFLCRCGNSKNKPFCDGSHKKTGFSSERGKPAGRDRLVPFEGEEIVVYFNPMLCAHAAECNRIAAHVFDAKKRPWIEPDKGTREEIEAVIAGCPSGALTMAAKGEDPTHLVPDGPRVTVEKNGPYWVADVELKSPKQGEGMSERKYVLCRCGRSGNKPFCDGTHRDIGWVAE